MPDLMSRIQEANRQLDVPLDVARVRAGVEQKQRVKRQKRKIAGAASLTVVFAALVVLALPSWPDAVGGPIATTTVPVQVSESTVQTRLLTGDAQIDRVRDDAEQAELSLIRGAAHFEVDPQRKRHVAVQAGFVRVEVVGTIFEISHLSANEVKVLVQRGEVRVSWPGGQTSLHAGQERIFEKEPATAPAPSASSAPPRTAGWRELANEGNTHAAYEALQAAGPAAVRDEPGDLFLAADVARRSGHPAEAIAPLRKLITKYPSDGRAPSAAFTLGLLELGASPAGAAQSFATCRRLQPGGPLAHDALAREVEAQSRAGNTSAARSLAERYIASYPGGRRTTAVKRFGGIE